MNIGALWTKSRSWRGEREQTVVVCVIVFACLLAGPTKPAWSEPLGEKDRFAEIGGPVRENIDLEKIKTLLQSAKGISLVDKLELRSHLTAFTREFYKFHKGTSQRTLAQLRERFDLLHRQLIALLNPENPQLSTHFEQARGALWSAYSDREAFTSTVGREVVKEVEGEGAGLIGQRYEVPPFQPGLSGSFRPALKEAPQEAHGKGGVKP